MKKERRAVLLQLIRDNETSTQEELVNLLAQRGFNVTQATVSRDVRELGLVKKSGELGTSVYSAGIRPDEKSEDKYERVFKSSVLSVDIAGHLVVIKSFPGMAAAACAALDTMQMQSIVGTIAGDDTVFVACKTQEDATIIREKITHSLRLK